MSYGGAVVKHAESDHVKFVCDLFVVVIWTCQGMRIKNMLNWLVRSTWIF